METAAGNKYSGILNALIENHGHEGAMNILAKASGYTSPPPTIDEFLDGPEYLGPVLVDNVTGKSRIYPIWRQALREIYPNPYYSPYTQIIITGAIGLGKSTFSIAGSLYDLCKITHLRDPQNYFGLIKSTEIQYALINATVGLAGSVLYEQMIDWIMSSPYFKKLVAKAPKGSLFPNKISVDYGSRPSHVLGKAIIGAILSEINFQNKVANQAKNNFTNILRRMQSRFMSSGGTLPGHIWIDSSKADADSFIENHIESSRGDRSVVIYDYSVWKVKEHLGIYCGDKFKVFVGDSNTDPFIVEREDQLRGIALNKVIDVPVEYRTSFESDINNSLRDIAGISTLSTFSFISSIEKISEALINTNPVTKEVVDLDFFIREQKLIDYLKLSDIMNERKPRFIHIDIGISNDKTGIACSYIDSIKEVVRLDISSGNYFKIREPVIKTEWVMVIKPMTGQQTALYKIRDFLVDLKVAGYPIALVSTDGYQSTNLRQDLTLVGIDTELLSVDRTKLPYTTLRAAILESRLTCVNHPILRKELSELIESSKKIDHPNVGCFTGNTLVNLYEKSSLKHIQVRFDNLSDQHCSKYLVKSYNTKSKQFSFELFSNPRITKEVTELIEIELEDGSVLRCTEDHLILTDIGYKMAKDLTEADVLVGDTNV